MHVMVTERASDAALFSYARILRVPRAPERVTHDFAVSAEFLVVPMEIRE